MSTMGCSVVLLAALALVVGFIPILTWINLFVALPLALVAVAMSGTQARKSSAQSADRAIFWITIAIGATIVARIVVL